MRDTINFVRIVPKAPSITFYTISTYDYMCTIHDGDSDGGWLRHVLPLIKGIVALMLSCSYLIELNWSTPLNGSWEALQGFKARIK